MSRNSSAADTELLGTGRIQSVERALRILRAFTEPGQRLTVAELARRLDVHKSTASRLAATLVSAGFLERGGENDPLVLGPQLVRLGRLAVSGRSLPEIARPVMDELAAQLGETVTLSVPDAGQALTIGQSEGTFAVGLQNWLGKRAPLHATSDGKVLLAFGAATLPAGELSARTPDTIVDRAALDAELAQLRERGWGSSRGDFELGLNGVAAPILLPDGTCRAALCLSGPAYRVRSDDLAALAARVAFAARRIAALLDLAPPLPDPQDA
ncbi:IclR family transcriptional regulator [Conexibacter sp. JD483]|uniref:IclR family transcriptional regulator n=1 Tax=unclassified Conexibacter TaxID=2627773 RepID=UPI00272723E3|nr:MULTISPECIES: IclR family transcriptional regulator [unclassified Conexibacter]MDO8186547.1 IclR family transcriptional regulator [Conexibacter sp. CPCC 205706]MDO8200116.1 IclR family transcriptional regulator [Conexibacter sp. CPCC 205762]MDR9371998.1 IclR family transcriptional regulator [Conexibacter sp. JD483]